MESDGSAPKALRVRPARGNRLANGGSGTQMEQRRGTFLLYYFVIIMLDSGKPHAWKCLEGEEIFTVIARALLTGALPIGIRLYIFRIELPRSNRRTASPDQGRNGRKRRSGKKHT